MASELNARYIFPAKVTVLDRAVFGMAILSDLREADEVLVIDALDRTGEPAGTIMQFLPSDLASRQTTKSAHGVGISEVLESAALLGIAPDISCLGVQVEDASPVDYQIGLTPAVEAAVPKMVQLVINWLAERGVSVASREHGARE